MKGKEEILLDINEIAADKTYFDVGTMSVSDSSKIMAWSEDTVGRRRYTIKFKNLETGQILEEEIANTTGNIIWAADNATVFYTTKDEQTLRADKVVRRALGDPTDHLVFEEKDETFSVGVSRSRSGQFIEISSDSTLSNETRLLEAASPHEEPRVFLPRRKDHLYSVEDHPNGFYVLSNHKSPNFKLMFTESLEKKESDWSEVIPHRPDVFLSDLDIFVDYIVVQERQAGFINLKVIPLDTSIAPYFLEFNESVFDISTWVNREQDTSMIRIQYESMTTPHTIYDFDLKTKKKKLVKREFAGKDYDSDNYQSKRLYARASDGTAIPITIVYAKNKVTSSAPLPTLLYGYGSYGYTIDPSFSSRRLSLLNRGVIFAFAHIRGSQILGRQWYEDGKLLKKRNTFTDFIAAGEFLVNAGYSTKDMLFAEGGSAGGLLMGAVLNMAPQLFRGVLAHVPFVDVVTTMLDDTIPLTTFEYDEWGNPNEKNYFDYMLSYSPYDNVEEQDYPALLVTTGYHDSQVQYWEPTKWVAKLREKRTNSNPLIFKTDMEAGHSGTTGRYKDLKDTAYNYAFVLGILYGDIS